MAMAVLAATRRIRPLTSTCRAWLVWAVLAVRTLKATAAGLALAK